MSTLLEARQARLGNNQSLFRAVNEEVQKISEAERLAHAVSFVCECANPDCGDKIVLSLGDYEAIRQDPMHFFVLRYHVFTDVETVEDDRGRYVVVEKFGEGGRVAAATDARSSPR